ncbi:cytochrome c [Phenylobacterium sp.]|uniref:c-type cytochrome n=1 Tax=Phenylobacterium sp. TaxID=1871053 RepID=UPI002E31566E|nr:cytochrome c [Phenylobacterium sp.]HEX4709164.1 cytochrome c [Phenylobacterium sp.]
MRSAVTRSLAPGLAVALLAAAAPDAQPATSVPEAWPGCCGLAPWAHAGEMPVKREGGSGYSYIVGGSTLRHHLGATGQIPAPYVKLRNPLPPTPQNAQRGAAIYEANCASCHGADGLGDGPASRTLKPPPAQLAWLAKLPPSRLDPFMYWSVADGGARLKTDMPSFKGKLTDEQIWSVIGYIQARLPKAKAAAR